MCSILYFLNDFQSSTHSDCNLAKASASFFSILASSSVCSVSGLLLLSTSGISGSLSSGAAFCRFSSTISTFWADSGDSVESSGLLDLSISGATSGVSSGSLSLSALSLFSGSSVPFSSLFSDLLSPSIDQFDEK